jgi:hypothetical protein
MLQSIQTCNPCLAKLNDNDHLQITLLSMLSKSQGHGAMFPPGKAYGSNDNAICYRDGM